MPRWKVGRGYALFLKQLAGGMSLKDDDDPLGSRPFVDRIHHLTDGLTGETYRLIGKLTMLAVQHDGQSLQEEWLGKVDCDRRNRSTTGWGMRTSSPTA